MSCQFPFNLSTLPSQGHEVHSLVVSVISVATLSAIFLTHFSTINIDDILFIISKIIHVDVIFQ